RALEVPRHERGEIEIRSRALVMKGIEDLRGCPVSRDCVDERLAVGEHSVRLHLHEQLAVQLGGRGKVQRIVRAGREREEEDEYETKREIELCHRRACEVESRKVRRPCSPGRVWTVTAIGAMT